MAKVVNAHIRKLGLLSHLVPETLDLLDGLTARIAWKNPGAILWHANANGAQQLNGCA
jgi:hypothetical protein